MRRPNKICIREDGHWNVGNDCGYAKIAQILAYSSARNTTSLSKINLYLDCGKKKQNSDK